MAKSVCSESIKLTFLVIAGAFLIASATMSYFGMPCLVEHIVRQKLMLSPESITFADWQRTPIPIYARFFLFNVTNAKAVEERSAKPILQELGPYTYLEEHIKVELDWNHSNGTVAYKQVRRWHFLPERSVGSLDDIVTCLNVPLAGAAESARRLGGGFYFDAINQLYMDSNETLFMRGTVRALLFDGLPSYMIEAAEQIGIPVPYDKFGWFYGKNNTAFDGTYRIFTGQSGTMDRFGLMDTWNNQNEIRGWNGKPCSTLYGSSNGDLRPPSFGRERPEYISVFSADICRYRNKALCLGTFSNCTFLN